MKVVKGLISFTAGRLATQGMEELILWSGTSVMGVNTMVVKIVAQILVIIGNYLVSKRSVLIKK